MLIPVPSGTIWRKSTRSQANGACVEVAELIGKVAVRDTKDRQTGHLAFDRDAFDRFLRTVQGDPSDSWRSARR